MNCSYCGNRAENWHKNCTACGAALPEAPAAQQPNQFNQQPWEQQPPQQPWAQQQPWTQPAAKNNAGTVMGVISIILGVLAMVVLVPFLDVVFGVAGIALAAAAGSKGAKGLRTAGLIVSIIGTVLAIGYTLSFL